MIVRIWRTQVDPTRLEEYELFAEQRSLPMFRAQRGFLGVLFVSSGNKRAAISFWEDAEAVAALDSSPDYQETVAEIAATGLLASGSSVEVFEVDGGDVSPLHPANRVPAQAHPQHPHVEALEKARAASSRP